MALYRRGWKPRKYRSFGGRRYQLLGVRWMKSEAEKLARAIRSGPRGGFARVVRVNNPYDLRPEYAVYIRHKRRPDEFYKGGRWLLRMG